MEIKRYETKKRMSRVVIHNNTVYLCGQVAKDSTKGMKEQTITTLEKIDELLASVGSNKDKILSATIYVKDMSLFQDMNEVWDNWVNEGFAPARVCVEAKMAREELLVELSIVAAV
ncbi:RidA family protein [Psychrilyobacter sp.]|uniref:RidA family protein n=1 Tax=Psychrilyobacter sp. TaxID=2586924 RepID=UPI00301AD0FB